jgi:DNA-binding transcriptional ArsR family regulator
LATGKKNSKKKAAPAGVDAPGDPVKPRYPEAARYTLTHLDQVKALADPLRLRLLSAFGQERTTKQVADLMGERPTRLYHHVEALEKVGLIQQTRTRPNRGTMEKYFLAVARSFEPDEALFGSKKAESEADDTLRSVVAGIMDRTKDEMFQVLAAGGMDKTLAEEGIISYVEIHSSDAFVKKLHKRLRRLLADLQRECAKDLEEETRNKKAGRIPEASSPDRRFRLTMAYFPLDRKQDD